MRPRLDPPLEPRRVYTPGDMAQLWGVSASTVGVWATSGRLPCDFKTPGGQRRWYADRIDALLAVQDFGTVLDGEAIE
jgi:DNA-binding transcriptional MerR regulator